MDDAAKEMILDRYRAHVARFERAAQSRRRVGGADAPIVTERPRRLADLTPKEQQVLDAIAVGLTDAEIADRLGIAAFTAKVHVRRIFAKLCARNRAHAVAIGIRQKLLQLSDAA